MGHHDNYSASKWKKNNKLSMHELLRWINSNLKSIFFLCVTKDILINFPFQDVKLAYTLKNNSQKIEHHRAESIFMILWIGKKYWNWRIKCDKQWTFFTMKNVCMRVHTFIRMISTKCEHFVNWWGR